MKYACIECGSLSSSTVAPAAASARAAMSPPNSRPSELPPGVCAVNTSPSREKFSSSASRPSERPDDSMSVINRASQMSVGRGSAGLERRLQECPFQTSVNNRGVEGKLPFTPQPFTDFQGWASQGWPTPTPPPPTCSAGTRPDARQRVQTNRSVQTRRSDRTGSAAPRLAL